MSIESSQQLALETLQKNTLLSSPSSHPTMLSSRKKKIYFLPYLFFLLLRLFLYIIDGSQSKSAKNSYLSIRQQSLQDTSKVFQPLVDKKWKKTISWRSSTSDFFYTTFTHYFPNTATFWARPPEQAVFFTILERKEKKDTMEKSWAFYLCCRKVYILYTKTLNDQESEGIIFMYRITRPALIQFQSLKIWRSANFM